ERSDAAFALRLPVARAGEHIEGGDARTGGKRKTPSSVACLWTGIRNFLKERSRRFNHAYCQLAQSSCSSAPRAGALAGPGHGGGGAGADHAAGARVL